MAKSSTGRGKGSKGNRGSGPSVKKLRSKDGRVARRITRNSGLNGRKRRARKLATEMRVKNDDRKDIQEGQ